MSASYTPAGYCPECGYPVDPGVCPECGRNVARPLRRPRRKRRRRLIAASLLVVVLGTSGAAYRYRTELAVRLWPTWHLLKLRQADTPFGQWTHEVCCEQLNRARAAQAGALASRQRRIENELHWLGDHEWAGSYRNEAGIGEAILIAPENGYVWKWWSCHSDSENHGRVIEVTRDFVKIRPATYGLGPLSTLVRVRWCGRRYLVPEEDIEEFARSVRNCSIWVAGSVNDRDDDFDLDAPLEIPDAFRKYFDTRTIEFTATKVLSTSMTRDGDEIRHDERLLLQTDHRGGVFEWLHLECLDSQMGGSIYILSADGPEIEAERFQWRKLGEEFVPSTIGTRFRTHGREYLERCVAEYRTVRAQQRAANEEYERKLAEALESP